MVKHAVIVIAHKNYKQLDRLICLLDNSQIDIFLHVDKKSPKYIPPVCNYSKLTQIKSMQTNWGGYSLVECELKLLEEVLQRGAYSFIHLISGQDLPIKPVQEILTFFDSNRNYNFIHYNKPEGSIYNRERVKYYYPFQDIKPRGRSLWSIIQKALVIGQKCIRIDRTKKFSGVFKSGSQWWSIKPDLAQYIVSQKQLIHDLFKYTMCDEVFVQTLVYNSDYYKTVFIGEEFDNHANQRLIDFSRGSPHIWTMNDIDEIRNSDLLFARKFDENVDSEIIDEVVKMVTRN